MSNTIKIKDIVFKRRHDSSPDGYGGYNEWSWWELVDSKSQKFVKLGNYAYDGRSYVTNELYKQLTNRALDFKECCQIFKQNTELWLYLDISSEMRDFVLRKEGKRTDSLLRKIEAKKKLVAKHKKELLQMLEDYNGRPVDYWDTYKL